MIADIPFIEQSFERFNELCFRGELPPVAFKLVKARTFLGKLEFKLVRGWFGRVISRSDFRIKISTWYDLSPEQLEDVIIHEMIHYYIALKGLKDSSAHGKAFRQIMKEINTSCGRHITISHKLG